jgi:hypothetical protein
MPPETNRHGAALHVHIHAVTGEVQGGGQTLP